VNRERQQQQAISKRNVTKQDTLYTTNTSYSLFTGSTQLNSQMTTIRKWVLLGRSDTIDGIWTLWYLAEGKMVAVERGFCRCDLVFNHLTLADAIWVQL